MDGDLITDQPVVHSERPLEPPNSNNGFDDIEEMAWWEALRSGWEQYMLWALCFIIFRITLTFLRLSNTKYKPNMKKPCKAMFVLGSGGHTTEMFHLLTDLNYLLFSPRLYVHGSNDQLSATRAIQFEATVHSTNPDLLDLLLEDKVFYVFHCCAVHFNLPNGLNGVFLHPDNHLRYYSCRRKDYVLLPISRIREVHQSLLTVPFTAALPLFQAPFILLWHRPDVLVANGPGICIPLILWSFVFAVGTSYVTGCSSSVFCLKRPVIIFVESFCRVQTLSLTARFMKPFVDRLIVQWRPLHENYKKATRYHGLLV